MFFLESTSSLLLEHCIVIVCLLVYLSLLVVGFTRAGAGLFCCIISLMPNTRLGPQYQSLCGEMNEWMNKQIHLDGVLLTEFVCGNQGWKSPLVIQQEKQVVWGPACGRWTDA